MYQHTNHLPTHLQHPSSSTTEPQRTPLSSTESTNKNTNANGTTSNNHNMYVSPISHISAAADHLWDVQIPDLLGVIHAIQMRHQAILHESSSSPYGIISMDPAEIFVCIQGASLRF